MRKIIIFAVFNLCAFIARAQQSDEKPGSYFYLAEPYTKFYNYNPVTKKIGTPKINFLAAKFFLVNDNPVTISNHQYYIVKFYRFRKSAERKILITPKNTSKNIGITNSNDYLNSADNDLPFLIGVQELQSLKNAGSIRPFVISYAHSSIVYGANLATPFKFRFKTDGKNYIFDPSVSLGGYIGLRKALTKNVTDQYFINLPILSAGFTTIQMNKEALREDAKDGLAWGFTTSIGTVVQLKDFQIGLLYGYDFVSGEMGRNWIYNEKPWVSFSIGYSFLGGSKRDNDKTEKALKNSMNLAPDNKLGTKTELVQSTSSEPNNLLQQFKTTDFYQNLTAEQRKVFEKSFLEKEQKKTDDLLMDKEHDMWVY